MSRSGFSPEGIGLLDPLERLLCRRLAGLRGLSSQWTFSWRERDSNFWYRAKKPWISAAFGALQAHRLGLRLFFRIEASYFFSTNRSASSFSRSTSSANSSTPFGSIFLA